MSTDTKWIIGTLVAVAALLVSLIVAQHGNINERLSSMEARLLGIEEHLRSTPPAVAAPDGLPKHR